MIRIFICHTHLQTIRQQRPEFWVFSVCVFFPLHNLLWLV